MIETTAGYHAKVDLEPGEISEVYTLYNHIIDGMWLEATIQLNS